MTTQKPELMPDEISLFRCECEGDIKWSEDSSDALATYVNEDLYTAACAERDEWRAIAEGLASEMTKAKRMIGGFTYDAQNPAQKEASVNQAWHVLDDAVSQYEKHRAGE